MHVLHRRMRSKVLVMIQQAYHNTCVENVQRTLYVVLRLQVESMPRSENVTVTLDVDNTPHCVCVFLIIAVSVSVPQTRLPAVHSICTQFLWTVCPEVDTKAQCDSRAFYIVAYKK